MPKCKCCYHEGEYHIDGGQYMKCQAPGGGPTQGPISLKEAHKEEPCNFFQPKKISQNKSKPHEGFFSFLSKLMGGKNNSRVKFKEKIKIKNNIYEVYTARNKQDAHEFLQNKPVSKSLYYIVVETPDGTWGKDIAGLYQEE